MKKLATIGYEGADLDDFISTLRQSGVVSIIDVRELPLSRRKGFSKAQLSAALTEQGIAYIHIRELGDPKDGRLAARAGDFAKFRAIYSRHLRKDSTKEALKEAAAIARTRYSCLLCFERDPNQCHRTMVAHELMADGITQIQHLGVRAGISNGASGGKSRTRRSAGESATAA